MIDESPSDTEFVPVPIGENVATFHEDGSVSVEKCSAEEKSSTWKGARRILSLPDSAILEYPARPNGDVWYRIENVSVRWRVGDKYFCGTPGHGHKCPEVRRIQRWRKEHGK